MKISNNYFFFFYIKFMSYKQGKVVENIFANLFDTYEWATQEEDINQHWDIKIYEDDQWIKYDVKGLKRVSRKDKSLNENIHWIELKNVLGNLGWLYGQADKFAFELEDYFLIVSKQPLQELIAKKCKDKKFCSQPTLYQLYSRQNREDIITLVKTMDLIFIGDFLIDKKTLKRTFLNQNI